MNFCVLILKFGDKKRGATTTPLIVPSAKFVPKYRLTQLYQGFEGYKIDRRFTAVFTAVFFFC